MKKTFVIAIVGLVAITAYLVWANRATAKPTPKAEIIQPTQGPIVQSVTTTGAVQPRNRLEIRPPVAGRLEQMLVKEGQQISAGQTVATMSSSDRAALIDAARGQGESAWKYWQEVYKPIQLVAPMDATVIVATLQPGQVVSTADPIVVLSDQLIIKAQVDESDIGKIRIGENASVSLDAYPDSPIEATVEHIYYESVVVSNVTVYKVDLRLQNTPNYVRSGMNAQVAFRVSSNEKALKLPLAAVNMASGNPTVTIIDDKNKEAQVEINVGITTNQEVEVLSGITPQTKIVVKNRKLVPPSSSGKNPFMPSMSRSKPTQSK